jgi:hypothetical protein
MKKKLTGSVRRVSELGAAEREQLYGIFERHYDNVSLQGFLLDLSQKEWIALVQDSESGALRGFSTLMLMHETVSGVAITAAFSGDTIIEREYWGEQELVRAWYGLMTSLRERYAPRKIHWFLVSKGYRTYLYLPTFFKEFYPRFDKETPPFEQELINALASRRYPAHFNAATGVIELDALDGTLKDELAGVPDHRRDDPHTLFFLRRNPGYRKGDELACVAEFSRENLKPIALRIVVGEVPAGQRQ